MDVIVPGEWCTVGGRLMQVAEWYVIDGRQVQITATDGTSITCPIDVPRRVLAGGDGWLRLAS